MHSYTAGVQTQSQSWHCGSVDACNDKILPFASNHKVVGQIPSSPRVAGDDGSKVKPNLEGRRNFDSSATEENTGKRDSELRVSNSQTLNTG